MPHEEKIGFGTYSSAPQKDKNKTKSKKSGIDKSSIIFFVLGLIFTVASFSYYFVSIFNIVAMFFVLMFIVIAIILAGICTLFIGFAQTAFWEWVGSVWSIIPMLGNVYQNLDKLNPYFPCFGIVAIIIDSLGLMFAIMGKAKERKGYMVRIIFMAISLTISISLMIGYLVGGKSIFL